jgi:hypothetical protein
MVGFMTEWFNVVDKLPEEDTFVLTYDSKLKEYRVDKVILIDGSYHEPEPYIWHGRLVSDWNSVSHWCELPSPHEVPND